MCTHIKLDYVGVSESTWRLYAGQFEGKSWPSGTAWSWHQVTYTREYASFAYAELCRRAPSSETWKYVFSMAPAPFLVKRSSCQKPPQFDSSSATTFGRTAVQDTVRTTIDFISKTRNAQPSNGYPFSPNRSSLTQRTAAQPAAKPAIPSPHIMQATAAFHLPLSSTPFLPPALKQTSPTTLPRLPPPSRRIRHAHQTPLQSLLSPFNQLSIPAPLSNPIHSGSFGAVFFAHLDSGLPVVLKRPHSTPTARSLFRIERSINKKLSANPSPLHWPQFLGDYTRGSQSFLVWQRLTDANSLYDYLSHRPLSALVQALSVPRFDSSSAAALNVWLFKTVVTSLLTALADLHSRGIVHRDVKPANILVSPDSAHKLQLIDFGSSCDVGNLFWTRGINTLDPLYAAPERRLSLKAPHKFDVFSVGMIGIAVLVPGMADERRLREFRVQLERCGFDLRRMRRVGAGGIWHLFDTGYPYVDDIFEVLCGMLKKDPKSRMSVEGVLAQIRP
eukprot:GFKZ01012132.1.p1 GENE.GFKZ01012132.1~~GFKZ01012132.1.p1  ORF type:complete len:503 (+),score=50.01 GFKZ01012132.1:31-1539(+)